MNTQEKILIVDSDPVSVVEIESVFSPAEYAFLTASNFEEALDLINRESVTRIILGENESGSGSECFVRSLAETHHGKETIICHLKDTARGMTCFPNSASDITQFAISRKSDIHLMKEKFMAANTKSDSSENNNVDFLLNEVFGTLKDYTTEMCDSIKYARQIQKALLPGESSLKRIMDCFVLNSPKNIVSGDFFWYTIRFNRVILAVADCTGHGVPAALLSIIGHNILNSIVNEKSITEPAQILKQLNSRVQRALENTDDNGECLKDGMDVAILSIDPSAGMIDFAGARRPLHAFINGEFIKVKGDLYSIGIHTPISAEFKQHRLAFDLNDTLYLCSDGFADQFGGDQNKKIGSRKFETLLSELTHLPTAEQKKYAESFLHSWKGHNEQTDDVLLLGIKPGSLAC